MNKIAYPRLIKRIQAFLIDSLLIPAAVFATLISSNVSAIAHPYGNALLLAATIFVLEPGMVALTGGTIGHHLLKIRVTKTDGASNINIFAATARFVIKWLLGWLSLIFVLTTTRHQAVHDLITGSMVVHKNTAGLPAYEILSERTIDHTAYAYPPVWRRIVVATAYVISATVALVIVSTLASSTACTEHGQCSTLDDLSAAALSVLWFITIGWLTVRGWNGMLYGCRRRPLKSVI